MNFYDKKYNIYSCSLKEPSKSHCGDSFGHLSFFDKQLNKEVVILVVSDGVSSCTNDHKASMLTCKSILEAFSNSKGHIIDRIIETVRIAHDEVRDKSLSSGTLHATLLLLVWIIEENKVYYVSVGDSRIFRYNKTGFELLTEDDVQSVLLKIGKETVIKDGIPKFANAITKAIGQIEDIHIDVQEIEFKESESMILATDGIHNNGNLSKDFENVLEQPNPQKELEQFVIECQQMYNDDATILVLRRNDIMSVNENDYERASRELTTDNNSQLYFHILGLRIYEKILDIIESNDSSQIAYINKGLEFLLELRFVFDKNTTSKLLTEYLKMVGANIEGRNLFLKLMQKGY